MFMSAGDWGNSGNQVQIQTYEECQQWKQSQETRLFHY